ncbi:VWD domain-containing protein, partial [Klebsiella pneumoniae]|uniref:VWD domain-containing protein n=1 Tax=Klebsiella pneumoniae TaxID=573 RepID=UPI001584FF7A
MVTVDGQQQQFDDKEIADLYNGLVQIYALPNGEVKVEIQDAFYMIFDGQRIKLTATSGKLRDSIRGLCGRFNEDKYEDFTVLANCVVRDSQKFLKTYQVEGTQQRLQRSQEWQQDCVQKVLPLYTDVISDRDAGRTETS